jgi:hypothetical protein
MDYSTTGRLIAREKIYKETTGSLEKLRPPGAFAGVISTSHKIKGWPLAILP